MRFIILKEGIDGRREYLARQNERITLKSSKLGEMMRTIQEQRTKANESKQGNRGKNLTARAFLCPHGLKYQIDAENDSGNSEEVHSKNQWKIGEEQS